jgi:tetratricopeptide (TPR) repeat protein
VIVAALLVATTATPAAAGLYSPDERCPFPVRPDGTAEELSFDETGFGRYKLERGRLAETRDAKARPVPAARQAVLDRIARRKADPAARRDPAQLAGLAADLFRTGDPASDQGQRLTEALDLLTPRSRDRVPDFRVLANLAHVHAVRGEWDEAVRGHQAALLDAAFPSDLAGATPDQRKWLQRVEKEYYRRWLRAHRDEAARRTPPADEGLFPLFDGPPPADAVAVVQQLLLWQPDDTRLHWLLADLYANTGRVRQAAIIYDELAENRGQSNRRHLMDARAAVKRAVAALPAATESTAADTLPGPPPDLLTALGLTAEKLVWVGGAAGLAVLALLALQVRAVRRRLGGRRP